MSTFPERLQRLRESRHPVVSRYVASELMGLSRDALRRYERGTREPGLSELKLIARISTSALTSFAGMRASGQLYRK